MTKEDVEQFIALENSVYEQANNLLAKHRALHIEILGEGKIETGAAWGIYPSFSGLTARRISHDFIEYEGDDRWSFGGHEHYDFELPTRYLYEDWQEEERERLLAIKAKEENYVLSEATRRRQEELKKLEQLKAKYEGTSV